MRLYIWADPYSVSFGTSGLFVVASSLEEAKALAKTGKSYSYMLYDNLEVPVVELGEPTRIVDLPCAEWHEWSE